MHILTGKIESRRSSLDFFKYLFFYRTQGILTVLSSSCTTSRKNLSTTPVCVQKLKSSYEGRICYHTFARRGSTTSGFTFGAVMLRCLSRWAFLPMLSYRQKVKRVSIRDVGQTGLYFYSLVDCINFFCCISRQHYF